MQQQSAQCEANGGFSKNYFSSGSFILRGGNRRFHLFSIIPAVLFLAMYANSASADEVAIEGYSPVSYFTEGRAEKGKPEFRVEYNGRLYYLTSEQQVEIFYAEPEKYQPKHDICPYSLTLGKTLPIDPTNFKVVGDILLLFHKSVESGDGLAKWNAAGATDEEQLLRANNQLLLLRF